MEKLRQSRIWKNGVILFFFFGILALSPLCVQADETEQTVTIYGLESAVQEKLSIPEDMPQSYQIPADSGETVSYRVVSGNSAKVSDTGLVTPKYTYWRKLPNYSVSVPEGEEYDYYTLASGETVIAVRSESGTYNITVNVEDYMITYGDEVMEAYIRENITDTMTDQEIMEAVARFPASYEYSVSHSGVYTMIVYGGGDCWASTSAITTLCEKLGILAWARNGNRDPGSGSGHMNAMAELNGVYYELEAGYSMDKQDGYRPYDVTVRDSLFSYYITSNGITIYQYDGYETTGVLQVPETIGGRPVTKIANSVFASKKFSEIELPDTLTDIGDFAFSNCKELTHMEIPASVSVIGKSIFSNCEKLADLSVADENANYKAVGQAVYSKDESTLVVCPVAAEVTILPAVTKIADYAFYYNKNLTKIVIPKSVTEMGEGAFGNCEKLSDITFEGTSLTRIGTHCFRYDGALSVIKIPSSVKSIGAFAFAGCYRLKDIYFMGDAPEFGEKVEGAFYDRVFQGCTAKAYYLENNHSWTSEVLGNHDGEITWEPWDGIEGTSPGGTDDKDNTDDKGSKDDKDNKNDKDTKDDKDSKDNPDKLIKETTYYDKKTGITISFSESTQKEAVLTEVDKRHTKGTFKIPNKIKANNKTYKITSIGKNVFKNQKQLKKVVIGKYVKKISENAFAGCEKLQDITIGSNVAMIGKKAFYGCRSLKSITIKSKKLTSKSVGSKAFKGIYSKAVIKVPKSRLAEYQKMLKSKGAGSKVKVKK